MNCCLLKGEHTLTCKDSYGDGWHGGYLEIGGKKYCKDFTAGREKTAKVHIKGIKMIQVNKKIRLLNVSKHEYTSNNLLLH